MTFLLAVLLALPVGAQQAKGPKLDEKVSAALKAGALPLLARAGDTVRFVPGKTGLRPEKGDVYFAFACYFEALQGEPLRCSGAGTSFESIDKLQKAAVDGLTHPLDKSTQSQPVELRLPRFLMVASSKPCGETQREWLKHRAKAPAAAKAGQPQKAFEWADQVLCLGAQSAH